MSWPEHSFKNSLFQQLIAYMHAVFVSIHISSCIKLHIFYIKHWHKHIKQHTKNLWHAVLFNIPGFSFPIFINTSWAKSCHFFLKYFISFPLEVPYKVLIFRKLPLKFLASYMTLTILFNVKSSFDYNQIVSSLLGISGQRMK